MSEPRIEWTVRVPLRVNVYRRNSDGSRTLLFENIPNGGSIDGSLIDPADRLEVDIVALETVVQD